jgi:hypothetical protein
MKLFSILLEIDFYHLINGRNKRDYNLYRKNLPTAFTLLYLNACEHLSVCEREFRICEIKDIVSNFSQDVLV